MPRCSRCVLATLTLGDTLDTLEGRGLSCTPQVSPHILSLAHPSQDTHKPPTDVHTCTPHSPIHTHTPIHIDSGQITHSHKPTHMHSVHIHSCIYSHAYLSTHTYMNLLAHTHTLMHPRRARRVTQRQSQENRPSYWSRGDQRGQGKQGWGYVQPVREKRGQTRQNVPSAAGVPGHRRGQVAQVVGCCHVLVCFGDICIIWFSLSPSSPAPDPQGKVCFRPHGTPDLGRLGYPRAWRPAHRLRPW